MISSIINAINSKIEPYFSDSANSERIIMSVMIILTLLIIYFVLTKIIKKYVYSRVQKKENAQNFFLFWRYSWMGIIILFALISFSGSIATLGISAAFLGMIMGWSLQAPVTGIAAWLMILLKRPFKIGDRIIVSGIIGDVVDITLTHIQLNQVGGTVAGEELTGRTVLIPNAILFQQIIHNYTFGTKYLLDEVVVSITFESDFSKAEKILIDAAKKTTEEIIGKTGQQPFVRAEIGESGVRMRLRYKTLGTARQLTASEISKQIINAFNQNISVEFAYPHQEIVHRQKKKFVNEYE